MSFKGYGRSLAFGGSAKEGSANVESSRGQPALKALTHDGLTLEGLVQPGWLYRLLFCAVLLGGLVAGQPGAARAEKQGARLGSLATAGAPLHTEKVPIGEKVVEVGFYMWPLRADQAALLFVQGPIAPAATSILVTPAGKTHASDAHGYARVDQAIPDLSWHEVTVSSRGDWVLAVHAGERVGRLPLMVEGPPEMPVWLAWVIGLSPLLVLAYFLRALRGVVFADDARTPWWVEATRGAAE